MAGHQYKLIIKQQNRSLPQNAMFHSIIGQVAKQAQHMGATWDAESWKRLLVWQFAKENNLKTGQIIPSLDGTGIVQLGLQTREFTKDEAGQFTDWLLAWCVENGVEIEQCSTD
jgi:hypothetical protein